MPWFKVDDDFYGHPKIKAIPRRHRNAAISLWVLAGSWCARYLTDGVIPDNQIQDLGYTQRDAANLVDAGLWIPDPGRLPVPRLGRVPADQDPCRERAGTVTQAARGETQGGRMTAGLSPVGRRSVAVRSPYGRRRTVAGLSAAPSRARATHPHAGGRAPDRVPTRPVPIPDPTVKTSYRGSRLRTRLPW
jgi:hypothetical protein